MLATEVGRRVIILEAAHRSDATLTSAMIRLEPIIEVSAGPVAESRFMVRAATNRKDQP
jgi:hypothetical protein